MSHKGNKLIHIPEGVTVTINKNNVDVKGKLGQLVIDYPGNLITVKQEDKVIKVSRADNEKQTKMYHGTVNANITNAIHGVSTGYTKKLKIVGVGYRAAINGKKLVLSIGFSHPVEFEIPEGLRVTCPSQIEINVEGFNKILVGEFAANVRAVRPPEPYKGKGIMYVDEHIIRKVGKTAESSASSAKK